MKGLSLLPDDLVSIVVRMLDGRGRTRFRCVCKGTHESMDDARILGPGYRTTWMRCMLPAVETHVDQAFHRSVCALRAVRSAKQQWLQGSGKAGVYRDYWNHVVAPTPHNAWRSTIFVTSHGVNPGGVVPYLSPTGCVWIAFAVQSTAENTCADTITVTIETASSARLSSTNIQAYHAFEDRSTDMTWYMGLTACALNDHEDKRVSARRRGPCSDSAASSVVRVLCVRTARFHHYSVFSDGDCGRGDNYQQYMVTRPWEHDVTQLSSARWHGRRSASEVRVYGGACVAGQQQDAKCVHTLPVTRAAAAAAPESAAAGPWVEYAGIVCADVEKIFVQRSLEARGAPQRAALALALMPGASSRKRAHSDCALSPRARLVRPAAPAALTVELQNTAIRNKALMQMDEVAVNLWRSWLRIGVRTEAVADTNHAVIPLASGLWSVGVWRVRVQ